MPTYDYRCSACSHEFELFQSMKDAPKRTCPKCGRKALERLIGTGAALLFKGSGFYETDYRSESYKKAASAESKPEPAKGDAKADPKPDPKPGPKPGAKSAPAPKAEPKPSENPGRAKRKKDDD